eukprot:1172921-Rhodomonas_salina.2
MSRFTQLFWGAWDRKMRKLWIVLGALLLRCCAAAAMHTGMYSGVTDQRRWPAYRGVAALRGGSVAVDGVMRPLEILPNRSSRNLPTSATWDHRY